MEVTVGNEEPVEGMCSEFLLEAEGGAAKAWLAKYQPQAQGSSPSGEKFPKFHLFQKQPSERHLHLLLCLTMAARWLTTTPMFLSG